MTPPGLDVYACPRCRGPLHPDERALCCAAQHRFELRGGLPRFLEDDAPLDEPHRRHARALRDGHANTTTSRDRLLRGTRWPARLDGETILDAGCGGGRFTEVLLHTGARVFAFDHGPIAELVQADFGDRAIVCQASLFAPPYRPAAFDRVLCYGVLHQTPDPESALHHLASLLRPRGHLAVDIYDRARVLLHARSRIRWLTTRLPPARLHAFLRRAIPLYMRLVPPLHPWNQLVVPLKDYRGQLPGLSTDEEIEASILDTLNMLAAAHDHPQYARTMRRWCERAGLVEIEVARGGIGLEVRARRRAD